MNDAIRQIQTDHQNLDRVLKVLLDVATNLPAQKNEEALSVLNDAIYYIQVFPQRFHHPMEEKIFFPLVRRHRPDLLEVLQRLEAQHLQGDQEIHELEESLRALERNWEDNRESFTNRVRAYVQAQRDHMSLEEREIIKPVRESLSDADRATLNSAYGVTIDPLFGENLATGFDALLKRITR